MWHSARKQEKKVYAMMVDHKKRVERRKAYYESKLGDPSQLLRIVGSAVKIIPDAESYYYHENLDNLMPWQGDKEVKIDRFDGRTLLDFISEVPPDPNFKSEDDTIKEELNFERYADLINNERLQVDEKDCLEEIEREWNSILLKSSKAMKGKGSDNEDSDIEKEDINMFYPKLYKVINDLPEEECAELNKMGENYGIKNYCRMIRVIKKEKDDQKLERDEEEKKSKLRGGRRRRRRRRRRDDDDDFQSKSNRGYNPRDSPTYEPYESYSSNSQSYDSESETDSESEKEKEKVETVDEFITEFGEEDNNNDDKSDENKDLSPKSKDKKDNEKDDDNHYHKKSKKKSKESTPPPRVFPKPEDKEKDGEEELKKLTPLERLKLKSRMALERQILEDERKKKVKEMEQQAEEMNREEIYNLLMTNRRQKKRKRRSSSRSRSRSRSRSHSRHSRHHHHHHHRHSRSRSRSRDRSRSRSRSRDRSRDRSRSKSRHSRHRSRSRDRHSHSHSHRHSNSRSRSRSRSMSKHGRH